MLQKSIYYVPILLLLCCFEGHTQNLSSVILDADTKNTVPYATVQLNDKGMITNEEGRFSFLLDDGVKETDSLFISCIGYESIGKPINTFTEGIIYLQSKAIELNPVIVTNKNYTPEEIIELVEENIKKNYHHGLSKKKVFLRQTFQNNVIQSDYSIRKSTIPALNKQFLDSALYTLPKSSTYYTEILGDLYGGEEGDEQKLDLIKASELYDKSRELDYDALEARLNKIVQEHTKTDSYFKIKSGLFGTKLDSLELSVTEVDSTDAVALQQAMEKEKKNKEERKKHFARYQRRRLGKLYENIPIFEDSDYNVLFKPGRYDLRLENFTYIGDAAVYVISFKPKGSQEYQGTLYINSDDFALLRMDFENVVPLKKFKLLGVSLNAYLAEGEIIFDRGKDGTYHLRYYTVQKANRIDFKRPVKIIEKNKYVKGRRKQNELSLKVDAAFGNRDRYEMVVFDYDPIGSDTYEAFKEHNDILPTYLPNYDPKFWQGYDIIAPNQAIQEFKSQVELAD